MEWNKNLVFASLVAVIGSGFQQGYHTGAPNTPKDVLTNWTSETVKERNGSTPNDSTLIALWGVATSLFCLGGVVGGLFSGIFANIYGRKGGLLVNNIVAAFALIFLCASKQSQSFEIFVIGRFIIGINSGLNGGLCPMYLNEISPVDIRGAIGCTYQIFVAISILMAQVAGMNFTLGTEQLWPFIFFISSFVIIFQSISLMFCPESPKFLLASKNNEDGAQKSLSWLRGGEDVSDEMKSLKEEIADDRNSPTVTVNHLFTVPSLRKPLIISIVVMAAQQFSGINAIIFYSTLMFQDAGLKENAGYATLGMGVANVIMSTVPLFLIEKAGRKTLLVIGFVGMGIATFLMYVFTQLKETLDMDVFGYPCIATIILFIMFFGIGPGSIPWFLVGEIFSQTARPRAYSVAIATNWFVNFLVVLGFGPLNSLIGAYVFLIFTAMNTIFALFIAVKLPETKNRTIEEIHATFK